MGQPVEITRLEYSAPCCVVAASRSRRRLCRAHQVAVATIRRAVHGSGEASARKPPNASRSARHLEPGCG